MPGRAGTDGARVTVCLAYSRDCIRGRLIRTLLDLGPVIIMENPIPVPDTASSPMPAKRPRLRRRLLQLAALLLVTWLAAAYLLIPQLWKRYDRRHPALENIPGVTHTASGIPGDPLNVALIGMKANVMKIMVAAKWYAADPLTLASCLEIADASVLKRPYDAAPVSNLYLWGRKEDLAFEKPVGDDPRRRHHVRYWRSDELDVDGRPLWVGPPYLTTMSASAARQGRSLMSRRRHRHGT